ncbi:MAG: adenosylcobinamide-GDP ribazoletransferase [Fibrobacteria bacterium]|nr:adenosylcobinamide-GDP ribazoletransferase [Fibrobacteria bacterium]
MKSFFSALSFLTILPVPHKWCGEEEVFSRSVMFYPLVGFFLGLITAVVDAGLCMVLPTTISSVIVVMLLIWYSGGLHLDGLADSFDGFFSSRPREEMLNIMRDSRVGAMGVIAIVFLILLKVIALSSIPPQLRWKVLILVPLAGRCSLLFHWRFLSYVRSGGGLATSFHQVHIKSGFIIALIFFVSIAWVLVAGKGLIMSLCLMGAVALFSFYCKKKIGGMSGDTLGAVCEISEAVIMITAVMVLL